MSPVPDKPAPFSDSTGDVVLLHGLGMNSWTMWLMARRLQAKGYRVHNWGYWSVRQSLDRLIPHFSQRFASLQARIGPEAPLFIVGHSMGSIIARAVAASVELPSLRRLVMLTPPNSGSHVASWWGLRLRWLTRLVEELADREDSLVNRLPRQLERIDVGVIAAARDFLVCETSTHLDCESDHIILPSFHTDLVFRRIAAEQIAHFLVHGKFHRECVPAEVPLLSNSELSTRKSAR